MINSRKEFTFTNSVDCDKETFFKREIAKLCEEYTDLPITFIDRHGETR